MKSIFKVILAFIGSIIELLNSFVCIITALLKRTHNNIKSIFNEIRLSFGRLVKSIEDDPFKAYEWFCLVTIIYYICACIFTFLICVNPFMKVFIDHPSLLFKSQLLCNYSEIPDFDEFILNEEDKISVSDLETGNGGDLEMESNIELCRLGQNNIKSTPMEKITLNDKNWILETLRTITTDKYIASDYPSPSKWIEIPIDLNEYCEYSYNYSDFKFYKNVIDLKIRVFIIPQSGTGLFESLRNEYTYIPTALGATWINSDHPIITGIYWSDSLNDNIKFITNLTPVENLHDRFVLALQTGNHAEMNALDKLRIIQASARVGVFDARDIFENLPNDLNDQNDPGAVVPHSDDSSSYSS
jgi:hypothetical protein